LVVTSWRIWKRVEETGGEVYDYDDGLADDYIYGHCQQMVCSGCHGLEMGYDMRVRKAELYYKVLFPTSI